MPTANSDLDSFYLFGRSKLAENADLTFDDLLVEWDSTNGRAESNEAIREGIADVDAGRTRPADDVIAEARKRLGISIL